MPIGTTLNNIPLATADIDANNNKVINVSPGTALTDAVNVSQLTGFLPTLTSINDLSPQTMDYDTSGY